MKRQYLEFEKPIYELQQQLDKLKRQADKEKMDLSEEMEGITKKIRKTRSDIYKNLTPWQRIQIARHYAERPFMLDYVENAFEDYLELHGDRLVGDDNAMPAGFARLGKQRCVVIGHQKGRNTKDNLKRNFGSAHPEGYRKAMRVMRLAEKFGLPVITLIDTPGAFPGIGAEERNIAEAIAHNLREMALLKTPILSVVIGEGGSGGALGIGVADRVMILDNAYYSVISPEGCAAILWKDGKRAAEAAEALKITAGDLNDLGVVDRVIEEPEGGAHVDPLAMALRLKEVLVEECRKLMALSTEDLLERRYQKFRAFGEFEQTTLDPSNQAEAQAASAGS
ncbi:MAG: acetyl-CoA carboxylase carboxyltransferase subunit alpha [Verrucomicrobiales bacterium]|nr:acetyl-CoA carboxylase carboxyltransferase subunit alpha [Verrucomicrobiales bacterium]